MDWSASLSIFDAHIDMFIMDRMVLCIQVVIESICPEVETEDIRIVNVFFVGFKNNFDYFHAISAFVFCIITSPLSFHVFWNHPPN